MKKEQSKKHYALSYKVQNGAVSDVHIKAAPLSMATLLHICEELLERQVYLHMQIGELTQTISDMKQKEIFFKESISGINGYVLKHETELFLKPWWKKFLGL